MSHGVIDGLPSEIQAAARILANGEVMWPASCAADAVRALTAAQEVVLGLDVRDYDSDESFVEIAWSSFEPSGADDVAGGSEAALSALQRGPLPDGWVLVTWR